MLASATKASFHTVLVLLLVTFSGFALPGYAEDSSSPSALRICADPANLPFSHQNGSGFENKLAEMLAGKLGVPVTYSWFPQTIGFIRNTLNAKKCDLILGAVADQEPLQSTNPYYRSAYALVFGTGSGLEGIESLSDPRLKGRSIGIVAGTPPVTIMATKGLLESAKSFPLTVDRRHSSPAEHMVAEVAAGKLDAGILWGPIAGYYARQNNADISVTLFLKENEGPQMVFAISMGVRHGDNKWKTQVNELISTHQDEIDKILLNFGVPLVSAKNNEFVNQQN